MHYWGQMFEMIVEIQKRLFALMEEQMRGVPGAKEAKAMMAMMPDLKQAQNLVNAMQGVMSSGGSAFSSMQRLMGDFARSAQQSSPEASASDRGAAGRRVSDAARIADPIGLPEFGAAYRRSMRGAGRCAPASTTEVPRMPIGMQALKKRRQRKANRHFHACSSGDSGTA